MAPLDNPFALLGDDDDGSGSVDALLAMVEAKTSPSSPEQQKQKGGAGAGARTSPSKPLPPAAVVPPAEQVRGERGRGRGGLGQGQGRGRSGGDGSNGDDAGWKSVSGYSRGYGGDYNGHGRGRDGGGGGFGGGRGRGRGRDYYQGRGYGNENRFYSGDENQGNNGKVSEEGTMAQGESYGFPGGKVSEEGTMAQGESYGSGERRPYRNGRSGEENREKGYSGGNRGRGWYGGGFRNSEGRGGRVYGGESRGFRGGGGRRYEERDGTQTVWVEGGRNGSENKEDAGNGKEEAAEDAGKTKEPAADGANNHDNESGRGMPETAEVPKAAEPEKTKPKQVISENAFEKPPEEEVDNSMTLDEYEKLLHEKRKALEALKTEERKVVLNKEFDNMQRVEKKREDIFIKLKSEKDKLKKDDSLSGSTQKSEKNKLKKEDTPETKEKLHKPVSINEFLKDYGRGRGRGRGGAHGAYMGGGFSGRRGPGAPAPLIEDPKQFPRLGGGNAAVEA